MKTTITLLALYFISAFSFCQTSSEADEQMIMDLIKDSFQDILSENKTEKLPQYYTRDFLLLEDGEVWDMKRIRKMMDVAGAMDQLPERINSFEFIEMKIAGDMAWVAYYNTAVLKMQEKVVGEMNWLESAAAVRTEEGWRLELLHSTVIKKEQY